MLDLAWTFEARMNPFCGLDEIDTLEETFVENGEDDLEEDGDMGLGGDGDDEGDGDWGSIWSVFESP